MSRYVSGLPRCCDPGQGGARVRASAALRTGPAFRRGVRGRVRGFGVTYEREWCLSGGANWECVSARAGLFCFSLTSAHLRELFWNS